MAPGCEICRWRNLVLPELQDEDACEECHPSLDLMRTMELDPEYLRKMQAMHEKPPPLWMEIFQTQKLHAASMVKSPNGMVWLKFASRNMRPINSVPPRHFQTITEYVYDYHGRRIDRDQEGMFTMYHCVKLEHLARPCLELGRSRGILPDKGMRYGSKHADGVGVYAYASEPWELFFPGDGYAFLELRMHGHITRVKGGSKGRYVLKSDQGEASMGADGTDCEVKAMFILYASAPEFVKC